MTVAAIVCEYNPFHNGHQYLIDEARRITKADYIIGILSGDFVQRGEPALINKWARAKACLQGGADMVVEIPCFASFAPANLYAYYSVLTAHMLGVVDFLVFGSESQKSTEELSKLAYVTSGSDNLFTEKFRANIDAGKSYPRSVADSLGRELGPNDILGIEYIKALKKLNSNITAVPLPRVNGENISSAANIRANIRNNHIVSTWMPPHSFNILTEEINEGRGPVYIDNYQQAILASFRAKSIEEIRALPYVSEGLEYSLKKNALAHGTLEEFLTSVTCARYTKSRIRRISIASMTGINAQDLQHTPGFIKILGLSKSAGGLMEAINKSSLVPASTSLAKLKGSDPYMASLSCKISDVYALGYPVPSKRIGDQEYIHSAVFK